MLAVWFSIKASTSAMVGMEGNAPLRVTEIAATAVAKYALGCGSAKRRRSATSHQEDRGSKVKSR
jgi:hypothetical protein